MDLTEACAPKSDQLNSIDLIDAPRTFTIDRVEKGSDEQPVHIHLVEVSGRPYKPSKGMIRVFKTLWGKDTTPYAGRRITLFREPSVKWAGKATGGIQISHMTDIDGPRTVPLVENRTKTGDITVQPLTEAATRRVSRGQVPASTTEPTREQIAACTDSNELHAMWLASGPELRAQIEARKAELDTTAPVDGDEA